MSATLGNPDLKQKKDIITVPYLNSPKKSTKFDEWIPGKVCYPQNGKETDRMLSFHRQLLLKQLDIGREQHLEMSKELNVHFTEHISFLSKLEKPFTKTIICSSVLVLGTKRNKPTKTSFHNLPQLLSFSPKCALTRFGIQKESQTQSLVDSSQNPWSEQLLRHSKI